MISLFKRTHNTLIISAGLLILCLALTTPGQTLGTLKRHGTPPLIPLALSQAAVEHSEEIVFTSRYLRINDYLFHGVNKLIAIA